MSESQVYHDPPLIIRSQNLNGWPGPGWKVFRFFLPGLNFAFLGRSGSVSRRAWAFLSGSIFSQLMSILRLVHPLFDQLATVWSIRQNMSSEIRQHRVLPE